MPGHERHLIELAATHEVGEHILNIVEEYRNDVLKMTGQSIADVNPTPATRLTASQRSVKRLSVIWSFPATVQR